MVLDFQKSLFISLLSALCLVEGLPQYVANNSAATPPSDDYNTIRYQKAETIHKYMNLSANPCDDFYEFACGAWKTHQPALNGMLETSPLTNRNAEAKREMIHFLNSYNSNETEVDRKAKDFYHSCMHLPYMSSTVHGYKLREIMKEFGEMPVLEGPSWRGMRFGWSETITKIYAKYGISILLSSEWESEKYTRLTYPKFMLEELVNYQEPYIQTYRPLYINIVKRTLINLLNVDHATADRVANEILDLDIVLARAAATKNEFIYRTPDEMERKYNNTLKIKKILRSTVVRLPRFVIENKYYLEQLTKVVSSTPEHILANYIFYFLIHPFNVNMPTELERREAKCAELTKTHFKDLYHNIMYRLHDVRQAEQALTFLFYDIKHIFKSNFNSPKYDWIKHASRRKAVKKLDDMEIVIVKYADVNFASKYSIEMNNTDYIDNLKEMLKLQALLNLNPREHKIDSQVSNLMYVTTSNNVYVNVAHLKHGYYWSPAYPNAINFGSLGFLLAHEIAHAFDVGSLNDASPYSFDSKTLKALDERAQCLKQQFDKYIYYGRPYPPMESQDENIADLSGMALIYDVYSSWLNSPYRPQETASEQLLPLSYTPEQLFFISYAQTFCSDISEAYRRLRVDEHPPGPLRVRSTLTNLEQFAKAFTCPRGSQMNPSSRCEIY